MLNTIKNSQIARFFLVGMLNTAFGYSLFSVLIFLELHYSFAVFISTVISVLFNFKTTGKLVFKNSNNKLLFKFIGTYVFIYFLNVIFLRIFEIQNINMYIAGAVLILPMALISYIINKRFVFQPNS